jgi:hypothetical protein
MNYEYKRIARILIEAMDHAQYIASDPNRKLSGAAKAYKSNFRKAQKHWSERHKTRKPVDTNNPIELAKHLLGKSPASKQAEKYEKIKERLPKLRKAVPKSEKRSKERSDPESMYSVTRSRRRNKGGLDNIIGS